MDPRFKLIMTLLFIAMLFMGQHLYSICFGIVFCILALALSRIPVKLIWKSIKPLIPVLLITAILDLFMVDSGDVYLHWHFLKITAGGVRTAVLMVTRIIVLLAGSSLLTYTTSPIALTDAIERLLSPLKKAACAGAYICHDDDDFSPVYSHAAGRNGQDHDGTESTGSQLQ